MSSIVRYTNPVSTLSNIIDEFFGSEMFDANDRKLTVGNWPRVDICENQDNYTIHADLPGLEKKDVTITIENNSLKIEGEKKSEHKIEKGKYYHLERSYGGFSRSFALPEEVDTERVEAKMINGVLEIVLPKYEKAKPRTIEVKVN